MGGVLAANLAFIIFPLPIFFHPLFSDYNLSDVLLPSYLWGRGSGTSAWGTREGLHLLGGFGSWSLVAATSITTTNNRTTITSVATIAPYVSLKDCDRSACAHFSLVALFQVSGKASSLCEGRESINSGFGLLLNNAGSSCGLGRVLPKKHGIFCCCLHAVQQQCLCLVP